MSNPKDENWLSCRGFTNNVRVTHKCPNAGNCEMYCCSVEKFSRMIFIRILTFCCLRTLKNACPLITPHLFNLNNLGLPSSCLLPAPSHAILSSLLWNSFFCHCEPRRGEAIFCYVRKDCFVGQRAPSSQRQCELTPKKWTQLISM